MKYLLFVLSMLIVQAQEPIRPVVAVANPSPGDVTALTQVTITFSKPVSGVQAKDLRINEEPALSVFGSGSVYTFALSAVRSGLAQISWDNSGDIVDQNDPSNGFDDTVRWSYNIVDSTSPSVALTIPSPNVGLRSLHQIEITFDRPVTGVQKSDLLINGIAATNVTGFLSGPYIFTFAPPASGTTEVSWSATQAITDLSQLSVPFGGGQWRYTLNPGAVLPDVIISEFMAENVTGLADEDGEQQDWIELHNRGNVTANLEGWSLSDDSQEPSKWVFPTVLLGPQQYLVVFASAKDRRSSAAGAKLHTNFKLNPLGEYLGLFSPEAPRQAVSEFAPAYPAQRIDFSYGLEPSGQWKFYLRGSPGGANPASSITDLAAPVHFSVERGFFSAPFNLLLSTKTSGAIIRYTFDGTLPTETNGTIYTDLIPMNTTRVVRAAAFKTNFLSSEIATHTYLFNLPANQRALPVLSIVTDQRNLTGPTGIMGISGGSYASGVWTKVGANDYYNPSKTGAAWERPASFEFINLDNSGFVTDAGIRVHASDYFRPRMHTGDKFSYDVFFRSDYGAGRLHYSLFTNSVVDEFNQLVLRAGSNDPINPFLRDELARRLEADTGEVASRGNFVSLFINGKYVKYYNPVERLEAKFFQIWHGGGPSWDVREQFGKMVDGDATAFNSMMTAIKGHNMTIVANYLDAGRRLDLTNYVDYLLPLLYGDTGDWPGNNWRAARERVDSGRYRFYAWDAEWSFGYNGKAVTHDPMTDQLQPGTEIGDLYQSLKKSPEFKLLFADRVHRFFFNNGPLTDDAIRERYNETKAVIQPAISGFDNSIATAWIPARRANILRFFNNAGVLASSNAPVLSQFGGTVPRGFSLTLSNLTGKIYYTLNGDDPRAPISGLVAPGALSLTNGLRVTLDESATLRARSLAGTNWSALTQVDFQVEETGSPLRITELMYHPVGGDSHEYIELQNISALAIDLRGYTFDGISFRFDESTPPLAGGARIVLIPEAGTNAFTGRYPNVPIAGAYQGSLSNGGERIAIKDRSGRVVVSITYSDSGLWPSGPDGGGYSLEIIDPSGDPNAPANWRGSANLGGSPGALNPPVALTSTVMLNEIMAENLTTISNAGIYSGWIELYNAGSSPVNLTDWSLSNDGNPRKFIFPKSTAIPAQGYLLVWCDSRVDLPGLHAGFALGRKGETLFLYDAQASRVDGVTFGLQVADWSIGRAGADHGWQLTWPTPLQTNTPASLADSTNVAINEFMANASPGASGWIELFNKNDQLPAALKGLALSGSNTLFQIKSLSFIPPGGFAQLFTDENPGGDHLDFNLPAGGGLIVLSDQTGRELDRVTYPAQKPDVALGRSPDGNGGFTLAVSGGSPGLRNLAPAYAGPMLNEVMAHNFSAAHDSLGRLAGWIELFNPSASSFNLTGFSLTLSRNAGRVWSFPSGSTISAKAYLILWCDPSRPASLAPEFDLNVGAALNEDSGEIDLLDQTGRRVDSLAYGFQITDRSIGRAAGGWNLLAQPTPGAANSATAALASAANLRLNEWMAKPAVGGDWFEIYNLSPLPVDMSGIYISANPSISGLTNFQVGPLSFIGGNNAVRLEADSNVFQGRNHASFNLDGDGGMLRISNTNLALIDNIDFASQDFGVSEGRFPDGTGGIIRFPASASPGAANVMSLLVRLRETGGALTIEFAAHPGASYVIETRESLSGGIWQTWTNISSSPLPRTISMPVASFTGDTARFFRVSSSVPTP